MSVLTFSFWTGTPLEAMMNDLGWYFGEEESLKGKRRQALFQSRSVSSSIYFGSMRMGSGSSEVKLRDTKQEWNSGLNAAKERWRGRGDEEEIDFSNRVRDASHDRRSRGQWGVKSWLWRSTRSTANLPRVARHKVKHRICSSERPRAS